MLFLCRPSPVRRLHRWIARQSKSRCARSLAEKEKIRVRSSVFPRRGIRRPRSRHLSKVFYPHQADTPRFQKERGRPWSLLAVNAGRFVLPVRRDHAQVGKKGPPAPCLTTNSKQSPRTNQIREADYWGGGTICPLRLLHQSYRKRDNMQPQRSATGKC